MSIELKIKSKHLALEPAIIRAEEKKLNKQSAYFLKILRDKGYPDSPSSHWYNTPEWKQYRELGKKSFKLYRHRTNDVRLEARATFLARAFLKGTPYKEVERARETENGSKEYDFKVKVIPRIVSMVVKYGGKELTQSTAPDKVLEWIG